MEIRVADADSGLAGMGGLGGMEREGVGIKGEHGGEGVDGG